MNSVATGADTAGWVTSGGYVDFYGYHAAAGGWMVCGWVPLPTPRSARSGSGHGRARITFEGGEAAGEVVISRFHRDDLQDRGIGVVLFLASTGRFYGRLQSLELQEDDARFRLVAADEAPQLRDVDVTNRLRPILGGALRDDARNELLALVARRGYSGENTLDRLSDFVAIEIDEAILCPPDGILLIGWYLAMPGVVEQIRVRCGTNIAALHPENFLPIERGDVIEAVGHARGFTDANCGFMAYVPDIVSGEEPVYLQIETRRREIGFKNAPACRLRGMAALRRILDGFDVQYGAVVPALAHVVAPAVERLNRARLAERPKITEMRFGPLPADAADPAPRHSIIVPLYGRIDFMEYQLGLLASGGGMTGTELIYVLDDPPKRRELQLLAESLYLRFGLPFRLLLLGHNVGFAPANNIGLAHARGEFICFLNSDVFPGTPDWMARLVARLEADATLGAVGPLLLFEDGSVQHEGMAFQPIPLLGDLPFPLHTRKGWRPRDTAGLVREQLITGACMVMRRSLAEQLGGFDEAYAIGDFEDTDLCMKIRDRGLGCAVDHDVRLYHLERKSQQGPGQRWRMNLTLYNAWVHHCRWSMPGTATQDDGHA